VKHNLVAKWYFIVEKMTWGDVKKHFRPEITVKYSAIEDGSKVKLDKFKLLSGNNYILSQFCGIPASKRAKLARNSAQALARGEQSSAGIFSQVRVKDKMQVRKRGTKYPLMTKAVTDFILEGWYSGTPVTRHGCYQKVMVISAKGCGF